MVYATVTVLQLQVADSAPLDGSVPTPVEAFYNRSRTPSPHALDDLTRGMVTLPDATPADDGHAGGPRSATFRPLGDSWMPPPVGVATSDDWETTR
eukprot:241713-Heterocapsa_arctica.AAC.1